MIEEEDKTDEEIIADGLNTIMEGVLCTNWQMVCDGYNLITGQDLEPPADAYLQSSPPKSKLSKIRELAAKTKNQPVIKSTIDEEIPNFKSMTVDQIKNYLMDDLDVLEEELPEGKKADLVKFATATYNKFHSVGIAKKKNSAGKFARGTMEIISSVEDEDEIKQNRKIRKPRMPRPRVNNMPKDNSNDPDATSRFYDTPRVQR